jgi:anthranilate/para-aminobenzoate synthase component II
MDLQLSTTGDMKKAIESIDSFTSYLAEQAKENPDKVYIFANKLIKDLKPLEKQTKDRAIHVQETY